MSDILANRSDFKLRDEIRSYFTSQIATAKERLDSGAAQVLFEGNGKERAKETIAQAAVRVPNEQIQRLEPCCDQDEQPRLTDIDYSLEQIRLEQGNIKDLSTRLGRLGALKRESTKKRIGIHFKRTRTSKSAMMPLSVICKIRGWRWRKELGVVGRSVAGRHFSRKRRI